MSPYPKDSPLKDKYIRVLAGSACYAVIAIANREWDPDSLEDKLDLELQIEGSTGRYRKMLKGVLPEPPSCRRIQKEQKGGDILLWRNHAYWILLVHAQIGIADIENALRVVDGGMRRHIWAYSDDSERDSRPMRFDTNLKLIRAVAGYENFQSLVTLTAWAREARDQLKIKSSTQCAYYARSIFAKAVCSTPQLFIRWPLLAHRYKNLVWSFPGKQVNVPWLDMKLEDLENEMESEEKKARNRGIKLPPKEVFLEINKKNDQLITKCI